MEFARRRTITLTALGAACCCAFALSTVAKGKNFGLIIAAKAGDQTLFEDVKKHCSSAKKLMVSNGFPVKNISVFVEGGGKTIKGASEPDANAIATRLEALSRELDENDTLWVFVFGHANINSKGLSFATKGGRMRGDAFVDALDKITARQFVFALNRQSSALMPLLIKRGNRVVVTATDDDTQLNPPLFPEHLFKVWREHPSASILQILLESGNSLEKHYDELSLAKAEEPQAFDGETLDSYPFKKLVGGILEKATITDADAASISNKTQKKSWKPRP
jgi:hypothetical protein